jgi:hypothetical protein
MLKKDESLDRLHPGDQDAIWILCVQSTCLNEYKSEKRHVNRWLSFSICCLFSSLLPCKISETMLSEVGEVLDTLRPYRDMSNNAGSVRLFLNALLHSLRRVVFLAFFDSLHRRGLGYRELVTVQQSLGHSTVIVTMRYSHTNFGAKRNATQKLEGFGNSLVTTCTKLQQSNPKVPPITPLSAAASYN